MPSQVGTDNTNTHANSDQEEYQNTSDIDPDSENKQKKSINQTTNLQHINSEEQFRYLWSQQDKQQTIQLEFATDRTEGLFSEFGTGPPLIDQANVDTFKEFLEELIRQDFTFLSTVWGTNFQEKINFIIDNWTIFKTQYDQYMKDFLNIVNRKIQNISIYEQIYPGLTALLNRISRKIEHKGNKNAVRCEESKEDIIFYHYLSEQQAKANKAGAYFFKVENQEKQLIGSYIADNKYYQKNMQTWKLFFFIGAAVKRYNINTSNDEEFKRECKKIYKFTQLLLKNNQLTQPSKKICCSKFFYMNFNITPLDNNSLICRFSNESLKSRVQKLYLEKEKKSNKKVEDKVEVDAYNREMRELMLDVCSLLNRGGGVVLLYAKRTYLETWVQGETILQDKKQFYIKLIEKGLQAIKPNIKLQKEVFITFVPVVKNPYEYEYMTQVQDEKDRIVNRYYIKGLYVPRIVVVPSQAQKMYEYQLNNEEPVSAIYENFERKEVKGEILSKMKKQKQKYFRIEEQDEQTRELLGKDYLYLDRHTCPQPYKGDPMLLQEERIISTKPDQQFKYMSMLVAHKSNHLDIQRKLHNKGIECLITDTFYNLKLKSSSSSAPLYHNIRFDQLLNQVAYNKEFEYNGRYILVIAVTTYIKILTEQSQIIPKANLHPLLDYVAKVFPKNHEVLELFKFMTEEGEKEYYIKCTSREATLLIYYLMHNNGSKCIFKNPKSLEKIAPEERIKRWELIYSLETKPK